MRTRKGTPDDMTTPSTPSSDPNPKQPANMETWLRVTLNSIGDAVIATDAQGQVTFMNPVAETMTGWKQEEALGKNLTEVFVIRNEETRQEVESPAARVLREGVVVGLANHTVLLARDGSETPIDDTGAPIRDAQGNLIGVVLVFHDISERKRAEQALQESEARYHQLAEERAYVMSSARCLLWHANIHNTDHPLYLHWDMFIPDLEAAQRFLPLELQPGQLYKEAWYLSRPKEDQDRCNLTAMEAVRAGRSYQQDFRCLAADGSLRWLHEDIHIETVEAGKQWRAVGVCTDVTERKRLEEQLLQAQKIESIGRLAGGVAHDFNNLLTVISGHTELAMEELGADASVLEHLRVIQQAEQRAADLTRQLLAFARKQVIAPQIINLNDLTRDMQKLLLRLLGENIELVTLLDPALGHVHVDPGQFEQILVNLAVNARDAMPEGGKLTLETTNITLDAEYAQQHPSVLPGAYVMLAVSDTGAGMEEAIQEHIFEPFFTTKEQGKGTGLGLATVYGIVKQSGGHIWLYSEIGRGSTFKIYLPRVNETERAAPLQEETSAHAPGAETILVVEDEPALRTLAATALQKRGYTVLEAAHGAQALQMAKDYPETIHLLVTDVIMPQMGGKELVTQLQSLRPDLKILYTSGYTDDAIVQHGMLEAGVAFLQKPFTPSQLIRKVREVMDT